MINLAKMVPMLFNEQAAGYEEPGSKILPTSKIDESVVVSSSPEPGPKQTPATVILRGIILWCLVVVWLIVSLFLTSAREFRSSQVLRGIALIMLLGVP